MYRGYYGDSNGTKARVYVESKVAQKIGLSKWRTKKERDIVR